MATGYTGSEGLPIGFCRVGGAALGALGVRVRREVVLRPMVASDLPSWYRREAVPCVQGVPHRQRLRDAMARPGPDVLGLRFAA
jgi:hypothetical protein